MKIAVIARQHMADTGRAFDELEAALAAGQPARRRHRRARNAAPARQGSAAPRPRRRDARAGLPEARPTSPSSWRRIEARLDVEPGSRRAPAAAQAASPTSTRSRPRTTRARSRPSPSSCTRTSTDESTWASSSGWPRLRAPSAARRNLRCRARGASRSDEDRDRQARAPHRRALRRAGQHRARAPLLSPGPPVRARVDASCSTAIDALLVKETAPSRARRALPRGARLPLRSRDAHRHAAHHRRPRANRARRSRPRDRHLPRGARRRRHRHAVRSTQLTALYRERERFTGSRRALRAPRRSRARAPPAGAPLPPHAWRASTTGELGNAERRDRSIRASSSRHRPATPTRSPISRRSRQIERAQGPGRRDLAAALRARRRLAAPHRARTSSASSSPTIAARRSPSCAKTRDLWEKRGNDEQQALSALRAAFELDPDDGETRAELERLAEKTSSWDALADAYEHGIETRRPARQARAPARRSRLCTTSSATTRAARSRPTSASSRSTRPTPSRSSRWTCSPRCSPTGTRSSRSSSRKSRSGRPTTRAAHRCCGASARPSATCSTTSAAPSSPTSARSSSIPRARSPSTRSSSSTSGATTTASWSSSTAAASSSTSPEDQDLKFTLLMQAAERFEKNLAEPREAIECLREAAHARSRPIAAFSARSTGSTAPSRCGRSCSTTCAPKRRRPRPRPSACDCAKRSARSTRSDSKTPTPRSRRTSSVLDEAPSDEDAIAAVHAHRRDARRAQPQRGRYPRARAPRQSSQFEKLVEVLEMRVRAQNRSGRSRRNAQSHRQGARRIALPPGDAEAVLIRALDETPEDAELYTEIDRLSAASGRLRPLRRRARGARRERSSTRPSRKTSGDVSARSPRASSSDDRRAIGAYVKAGEQAGDDAEILAALDRLYEKTKDFRALAEILERRVQVDLREPGCRRELFYRLAKLQIDEFEERSQGLAHAEASARNGSRARPSREALEALTEDATLFEEAAEALEAVYRAQNDNDRLTSLAEKRIAFAGRPAIASASGSTSPSSSKSAPRTPSARNRCSRKRSPTTPPTSTCSARSSGSRLPTTPGPARRAVSPRPSNSARDLTPDAARDAYVRLASWYEDKLEEPGRGRRCARQGAGQGSGKHRDLARDRANPPCPGSRARSREEPAPAGRDRARSRRPSGSSSAKPKSSPKSRSKTPPSTEEVLRQLLAEDEANHWALEELTRLREAASDWNEVLKLLMRRAELSTDGLELARLQHQAAEIAHSKLDDVDRAVELYETIFENTPTDDRASSALASALRQERAAPRARKAPGPPHRRRQQRGRAHHPSPRARASYKSDNLQRRCDRNAAQRSRRRPHPERRGRAPFPALREGRARRRAGRAAELAESLAPKSAATTRPSCR